MLSFSRKSLEYRAALERVRAWTHVRFKLANETAILVTELACAVPGCLPLETVVAFWADEKRHHFKIFKPVEQVAEVDLPFAWMKDALAVPEGFDCDCC
jgi:nitrate reductase delta subunit